MPQPGPRPVQPQQPQPATPLPPALLGRTRRAVRVQGGAALAPPLFNFKKARAWGRGILCSAIKSSSSASVIPRNSTTSPYPAAMRGPAYFPRPCAASHAVTSAEPTESRSPSAASSAEAGGAEASGSARGMPLCCPCSSTLRRGAWTVLRGAPHSRQRRLAAALCMHVR